MAQGLAFNFGIFGDRLIRRRFIGMIDASQDMRPAWYEVEEMIYAVNEAQFDSQGARGPSGAWAPLRLSTLRQKAAKGFPNRILVAEGDLRDQATGNPAIREIHETWMAVGIDHPAGQYHQQGTTKMPQRRVFDFTEEDKRTILKPIQARIIATGARADRRFTAL